MHTAGGSGRLLGLVRDQHWNGQIRDYVHEIAAALCTVSHGNDNTRDMADMVINGMNGMYWDADLLIR